MSGLRVESVVGPGPMQGVGLPLVLVHGWAMNAAVWEGFDAAVAHRAEIFRLELPGHGHSPWTGLSDLSRWAASAYAAVPQPAVWLGWSLGAQLALRVALDHPGAVRAIVVVAGTPRFLQADDWPHALAPEVLERFGAGLVADPGATIDRFLALQVNGAHAARVTLRRLKDAIRAKPAPHPEALAVGLELLRSSDLRPELARLEIPVLWLLGQRDTLVPAAMGGDLDAWLPGARVEVVAGAGHAPFLSHGPEVVARLGAFLEGPDV